MTTTLVTLSGEMSRAQTKTCSAISRAFRFLLIPSSPVAQNVQPIGHPTCVEMHTVRLAFSGIITVSIAWSSRVWNRYFLVPSVAWETRSSAKTAAGASSVSAACNSRGRFVASLQSRTSEPVRAL
jgi:hypothetical protein